ncbi:hypothetical protein [Pseudoalteromonas ostreae]|uniref:hypothetical protein n=1 Tax=Pseudoalteromonas ostreae TaxID=2774154 RepID=UPI001B3766DA|nr:hypothetical protein [Pseudoalteromonas ostreae]
MQFINTFNYHKDNPDITISEHYRKLRLELAASIKGKKKIYLDTKFWVLLRNGLMNPSTCKKEYQLLLLAQKLVKNKVCVFPISEDVYLEVTRQSDIDTLRNTVKLIDQLSLGISTISYEERVQLELMQFYNSHLCQGTYSPQESIWTKLAYTMGFSSITHNSISDSENLAIEKAFVDQMWSTSLSDQIEIFLLDREFIDLPAPPTAENINLGQFSHMHEALSFKQMFMNEIAGWLDVSGDMIYEVMRHIYNQMIGEPVPESRSLNEVYETKKKMNVVIYNMFRLEKMGVHLPSAHIISGLYSAVRWDKKQKFQDHDFHDFRHASVALPYFDYFFTEKRLTHLVTQNQLKFDRMFNCNVCCQVTQAIKVLESIA